MRFPAAEAPNPAAGAAGVRAVPDGGALGRAGADLGAAGLGWAGAATCEAVTWRRSETRGVGSLGGSSGARPRPAAEGGTAGSGGTVDAAVP